jgi:hypothetical protein
MHVNWIKIGVVYHKNSDFSKNLEICAKCSTRVNKLVVNTKTVI